MSKATIHQTPGRGIGAAIKRTPAIHSGRIGSEAGRQNNPCIASGRPEQLPYHFASADEPTLRGNGWLESQWEEARLLAASSNGKGALLILDEVQKVPHWAETVKYLWDEDTRKKTLVKTVLLGSAPLLIGHGLTESLAGRFEILHMPHWSFSEMREAFGWDLKPISVLRCLSRCRAIDRTTAPLVALYHRLSH